MGGAFFIAAQAHTDRMWIAGVLVLAALVLAPFRASFYRHARLLSGKMDPSTAISVLALAACVLALIASERTFRDHPDNSWWEIVLSREVPNSLRVTLALTVILALVAIWRLLMPGRVVFQPWGNEARARFARLGALPVNGADGLIWGEADRAAIAFRRVGRVMLGLGDPVGAESDRASVIWRLRDVAMQEGLDPAVWRAGAGLLKVYGDIGLTALPLGPDGLPLPESEDETPASCQYLVCVAQRDLTALLPLLPELAKGG